MLGRRVGVDHQGDVVDVNATRGDVGGDQRPDGAAVERVHVADAGVLAEVAVQVDCRNSLCRKLLGQLLGSVLGAGEDDGAAGGSSEVDEHRQAVVLVQVQDVVVHRADRRLCAVGVVGDRVGEVALDEHVDTAVEGRGEQQALSVARGLVQDALHAGQEAQVGHVVGLVEDGDLDRTQVAKSLGDKVFQAARAGDDDVDALRERSCLRVLAHATEDGLAT